MGLTSFHHRILAELQRNPLQGAEGLGRMIGLSTAVTAGLLDDLVESGHITPKVELALSYHLVESIGRCAWCGLVSHHLICSECPACRAKVQRYTPRVVIRGERHS